MEQSENSALKWKLSVFDAVATYKLLQFQADLTLHLENRGPFAEEDLLFHGPSVRIKNKTGSNVRIRKTKETASVGVGRNMVSLRHYSDD